MSQDRTGSSSKNDGRRPTIPPPQTPARGGLRIALPWLVAAVCAAAAAAAWLVRPPSTPSVPSSGRAEPEEQPATPGAGDEDPAGDDAEACRRVRLTLRTCQRDIDDCRNRLDRANAPRDAETAAPPEVDCLARPDVLAEIGRRAALQAQQAADAEKARVRSEAEARNSSARRLMEQALGLSQEESGWLAEFTCRARKMQEAAAREVVAGRFTPEEAWRGVLAGRRAALRTLVQRFAPGRLPPNAELGALLVMLGSVDCTDEAAP
jgi:hypothetical protein